MKAMLVLILLALATVVPLIFVGSAHRDDRVGNSLYVKGLQTDRSSEILKDSDISWDIKCVENCRLEVNILPEPDNGTVDFSVFLPGGGKAAASWAGMGERWLADFKKGAEGWYDISLDYTYKGVPVSLVKSFYIN
ncbi:MAG: hypothetical protein LBP51_03555 [Deferribacteraceae bacterium]|jgi:hypothetical protein|nr:hypothetical protein [Deferribacteraceae bacterium]